MRLSIWSVLLAFFLGLVLAKAHTEDVDIDLWVPQGDGGDAVNMTSALSGPFDEFDLEKRQSYYYCPTGYGECPNGKCCPTPGWKCCTQNCAPTGGECCSGGRYCNPGYTCVITSSGRRGCCPEGGCFSTVRTIYWYYYIYWYIQVYYEIRVDVTTSTLSLTSSRESTSTRVSLTASNSASASSILSSLSSSYSRAAATSTPDLDDISTYTTTSSTTRRSTTTTTTSSSSSESTSSRSTAREPEDEDDTSTVDDVVPSATAGTADAQPRPTTGGGADNGTIFAGEDAASAVSSHSLWAYFGLAGLSFTMMVCL